ncbi:MAG: hypothetical protein ACLFVQ_10315 [Chitinispirillaceae bacterium]
MNEEDRAEQFLRDVSPDELVVILYHGDPDGISGAVMVYLALESRKCRKLTPVALGRGENPFSEATLKELERVSPDRLVVIDSGSREGRFSEGVRALIIDHHVPHGNPEVEVFFSSYLDGTERIASEAAYDVARRIVDHPDFGFYVLIGIGGDLGLDKVPSRFRDEVRKYGRKKVYQCVTLMNAARRHHDFDANALFRMLRLSTSAEKFLGRARSEGLANLREEVNRDLRRNLKVPPRFRGKFALLDFKSPHQIHPLIAVIWAGRLEGYVVIAANRGYLPGMVNFSMRTSMDMDLLELLREYRMEGEEIGYGHRKATGGILPRSSFDKFLRRLGF